MIEQLQTQPGSKAHVCHLLSLTDSLKMGFSNTLVNTCTVWLLLSLHAWQWSHPTIVVGPVGNVSLDVLGGTPFATPDNWFCASEALCLTILPLAFFLHHLMNYYPSALPSSPWAGQANSLISNSIFVIPAFRGWLHNTGPPCVFKMAYQEDAQSYVDSWVTWNAL